MSKLINVHVGQVPGRLIDLVLPHGTTVRDALEAAELSWKGLNILLNKEEVCLGDRITSDLSKLFLVEKEAVSLDLMRRFATYRHDRNCHASHTDRCGWLYELKQADRWRQCAHREWLESTRDYVKERKITGDQIYRLLDAYDEFQRVVAEVFPKGVRK